MELSPRKQLILATVVKHHIATGEPIGSKELASLLDSPPSTATLRNEMNELDKLGFLHQPHTSAGRIPTSKGYRFYINNIMEEDAVPEQTKQIIDETLQVAASDTANLPVVASKLLSRITGLPSVSAVVSNDEAVVRRVKLVPVGSRVYMVAVIISDGRSATRLFRHGGGLSESSLNLFEQIVLDGVIGKKIGDITPAAIQNMLISAGLEALSLAELFNMITVMLSSLSSSRFEMDGETDLFSVLGGEDAAKGMLSFLKRREGMLSLLNEASTPISVVFGNDTVFSELSPSAVIVARYGGNQNETGRLAVIGPTRMSYERILPSVNYLAERLSVLMNECINDMEEN